MDQDSVAAATQQRQEGEGSPLLTADALVRLRRESDWTREPRKGDEAAAAAYRAALDLATATLVAHGGGTASHSDDVTTLCLALAEELGVQDRDRAYLLAAAELHDIGKIAVPTEILCKPAPLDDAEWQLIREHTVTGERILGAVPELAEVARIVRHCHERWDGAGYPDGVAGEQIPLAARIVFCADAFHAIRGDRPYRRGRSARAALAEVKANSGTQFDPMVVNALEAAALQLRDQSHRKLTLVMGGRRSQRLMALLLTLAIGGGAMAATGVWGPAEGEASPEQSGQVEKQEPAGQAAADRPAHGKAEGDRDPARGEPRARSVRATAPARRAGKRGSARKMATGSPRRELADRGKRPDHPAARPPSRTPVSRPLAPSVRRSPSPPATRPSPPHEDAPSAVPVPPVTPVTVPVPPVTEEREKAGNGYGHLKGVGNHTGHDD